MRSDVADMRVAERADLVDAAVQHGVARLTLEYVYGGADRAGDAPITADGWRVKALVP